VKDSSGSTLGGHTVTWGSSAPGIATVNASTGLVTAIAAGTATVVASTSGYPAATRTTTVTVTAPPAPVPALIAITPAGATLSIGATQQMTGVVKDSSGTTITGLAITWSANPTTVATVNSSTGLVTAVSAGTVSISAATATAPWATRFVSLTVLPNPPPTQVLTTIVVTPASQSLLATETQQFTATGYDKDGGVMAVTPVWSVIAGGGSISASGLFTAGPTAGTYTNTIRAMSGSVVGLASIVVNAAPPPTPVLTAIRLTPVSTVLVAGRHAGVQRDGLRPVRLPDVDDADVVGGRRGRDDLGGGLFTAGIVDGTYTNTVKAASGAVSGFGTVTVSTPPPPPPPPPPSTVAELPRAVPVTTYPTGLTRVNVAAGAGNLQAAINAAACGTELVLPVGATFTENITLPFKACTDASWIVIRGNVTDAQLGAAGTRMTPTRAATLQLPKILNASTINESGIVTALSANHYRFTGVEISLTGAVTTLSAMIRFGTDEFTQTTANTAHHLMIDRSYVHATETASVNRCLAANGAWWTVIDSWFANCHGSSGDSQAIDSWNGPGPSLIQNNHLEGGHEVVVFGGGSFTVTNGSPSDATVRGNHLTRPAAWKGSSPYPAGTWQTKNIFETKHVKRLLLEGNVIESNWADAQNGFCLVLKAENQDNDTPWTTSQDVTIRYNVLRNCGSVFSFAGKYSDTDSRPSVYSARFSVYDNYASGGINVSPYLGDGIATQALNGLVDLQMFHNTILNSGSSLEALLFDGNAQTRLVYHSNVVYNGQYGVFGSGGGGTLAIVKYAPGAVFANNRIVNGDCSILPVTTTCPVGSPGTLPLGYGGDRVVGADIPFVTSLTAGVVVIDGAVSVLPGQSIQAAVDANPPGATILLKTGTHVRQTVVPKDNDTFLGESGTVMDGQNATQFAFKGWNGARWVNT
jgi:hypothetical protein